VLVEGFIAGLLCMSLVCSEFY